jgi:hypothetical protein
MLQVTPYTSLKLHGRTTELPWSDFNRQVIRFTRHTLRRLHSAVATGVVQKTKTGGLNNEQLNSPL